MALNLLHCTIHITKLIIITRKQRKKHANSISEFNSTLYDLIRVVCENMQHHSMCNAANNILYKQTEFCFCSQVF